MAAAAASWSELPLDLLGLVLESLTYHPADRARARGVCRQWRSAVRFHERRRLPLIVGWEDRVYAPMDQRLQRLPALFPDNAVCLGSTDAWLAIGIGHKHVAEDFERYIYHSYVLHSPFGGVPMPLTTLEDVVINRGDCKIYKFLMRSALDVGDFIAVITDNANYPIVVFRQGKGAWVPPPRAAPYVGIIDVAFLGDTLYAINENEDLIPLNLALDGDGKPIVTMGSRVVPGYFSHEAWSGYDDDDDDDDDDDGGGSGGDDDDDDDDDDQVEEEEEEEDEEEAASNDDGTHLSNHSIEFRRDEKTDELIMVSRHLIQSCGRLFMVRRHTKCRSNDSSPRIICVDVLEADTVAGAWMPLPNSNGLGGGQALFISTSFSKFVSAPCGQVEEDVIYDIDSGEVFDMKSQVSRMPRFCKPLQGITWLFPPELVV